MRIIYRSLFAFILTSCVLFSSTVDAQETGYQTFSPVSKQDSTIYLEGQLWPDEVKDPYDRFPARAEKIVREAVWNLSTQTAGMQFRFRTDAKQIIVKYQVKGGLQKPHMPATGVSGVDLYAKDRDGNWLWCRARYSFNDTIEYVFNIDPVNEQEIMEYTLYLPLYNAVSWMNVQVADSSSFTPLPRRLEKPVIVYGTSIAQGACASRPGMAWTNILSRNLDLPVVNLAFSGNGRLEPEVISLIAENQSRLFILDCLPNLTGESYTDAILKEKITKAVGDLRKKHANTPILLTEHAGYTDGESYLERQQLYERVNTIQQQVYDSLSQTGLNAVYYLDHSEIGQGMENTVDGTHPTDLGMMRIAAAYTSKIRSFMNVGEGLNEPEDTLSTTRAKAQYRDAPRYFGTDRHQAILKSNQRYQPDLVLIGNSITHFWGGMPPGPGFGKDSWDKYFSKYEPLNLGFGWDRIENALWRVRHDELRGISPSYIVVMLGVNNLALNSDEEIIKGMKNLMQSIRARQPQAALLLMGILPCRDREDRVSELNKAYQQLAGELRITFADAGSLFLEKNGKLNEALFSDGVHPNAEGYELLGKFIDDKLREMNP